MMKHFETIDISGDAGIRAYGETVKDLFINAATGMYSLITDLDGVKAGKEIFISVESLSADGLLVSWLNELIFNFDTYGFIGKEIVIDELALSGQYGGKRAIEGEIFKIKASVHGEDFDPDRHERRLLLKAATYHRLRIEKKEGMWVSDVIFDI